MLIISTEGLQILINRVLAACVKACVGPYIVLLWRSCKHHCLVLASYDPTVTVQCQ